MAAVYGPSKDDLPPAEDADEDMETAAAKTTATTDGKSNQLPTRAVHVLTPPADAKAVGKKQNTTGVLVVRFNSTSAAVVFTRP